MSSTRHFRHCYRASKAISSNPRCRAYWSGERLSIPSCGQCPLKKKVSKGLFFEREALMPGLLAAEGRISTLEDTGGKAQPTWRHQGRWITQIHEQAPGELRQLLACHDGKFIA